MLLLLLFSLTIFAYGAYAQELKPMAPPMDISTTELDTLAPIIEIKEEAHTEIKSDNNDNQVTTEEAFSKKEPLKTDLNISLPDKADAKPIISSVGSITIDKKEPNDDNNSNKNNNEELNTDNKSDKINKERTNTDNQPETTLNSNKHNTEIENIANIIKSELQEQEPIALRDLRILWQAAVEKSVTIRLAIQKLSNPNESDKMNPGLMEKVLSPLANLAPIAAMASTSSGQTAGALLGGGVLGSLANNDAKQFNKAFLRVNDYDLIMLAKEIDELQSDLVISYYEYKQKLEEFNIAEESSRRAYELYEKSSTSNNFAATTAADAFYRESLQNLRKTKQDFLSVRTNLEQLTGNEAIVYIQNLKDTDLLNDKFEPKKDEIKTSSVVEKDKK